MKDLSKMSVENRYIPVLQIEGEKLVKTFKFSPKRYLGDPLNAIRVFNLKGVSEIVITDIRATLTKSINFEFLKRLSAQAFVPLTYGGGISSLDDIHKLYQIGFDRMLLGTAAIQNPKLIKEAARIYGSQSIICSLDVSKGLFGLKVSFMGNRKKISKFDLKGTIKSLIDHGAGEILFHDVERDGTYKGLNHQLIEKVSELSSVPIIVCGGAKDQRDMERAIESGASAVAVGSLYSFYGKHKAVLINYGAQC